MGFMAIDTTFNFQSETEPLDADKYSKRLQEYHKILWSKPLPNGKMFNLESNEEDCKLTHNSVLGKFVLSSDRAVSTFTRWGKMKHITSQIPKDKLEYFRNITESIGAIIIWPSNRIDNKLTINGARGLNSLISDRLDLTLEGIRRYYLKQDSPLYETLKRYDDFFNLFEDFKGYIDFFLFQDAVSSDYKSVKIAVPFDNFKSNPVPKTVDEYIAYMNFTIDLIQKRNSRIKTNHS